MGCAQAETGTPAFPQGAEYWEQTDADGIAQGEHMKKTKQFQRLYLEAHQKRFNK